MYRIFHLKGTFDFNFRGEIPGNEVGLFAPQKNYMTSP